MQLEDAGGFRLDTATLACANLVATLVVQITKEDVRILDASANYALVARWAPPHGHITLGASAGAHIVVAMSGGTLTGLHVHVVGGAPNVVEVGTTTLENEVACLALTASAGSEADLLVAAGMWSENTARLLSLPVLGGTFVPMHVEALGGDIQPR